MTRSSLLFVLLLSFGFTVARCQENDSFDTLVEAASHAQTRGDYAAAAKDYQRATVLRPDLSELWSDLGLMQDVAGSYSKAITSFRRAILLKPELYVPNLFLGIDYLHLQQPQQAISFLRKAEKLNPHDAQASLNLGLAYASLRNYIAASGAYRRALELDPADSAAWFDFGRAALNEVETDGWKLSSESPDSTYARALYAESLGKQLRFKEAITAMQGVLASDPHFACGQAQLGFFYLAEGQPATAAQEFTGDSRNCGLADLGQADLRIRAGENAQALILLRSLWKRDPGFVRANLARLVDNLPAGRKVAFSGFVAQQYSPGAAETELYMLLTAGFAGQAPENPKLRTKALPGGMVTKTAAQATADYQAGNYGSCVRDLAGDTRRAGTGSESGATKGDSRDLLLADCAYMTGDYDLAARASDEVLARSPRDAAARYWSAKANELLAFDAFNRFEQLRPNSERVHLMLGDMYRQRQRFRQAESEYREASVLAPEDAAPLYGLALTYSQDSEEKQAFAIAQTLLKKDPNDPDFNLLTGEILVADRAWSDAEPYLKRGMGAKPQMLPHLHVLLGEVYEHTYRPQQAIQELELGASSDETGGAYYQLGRLYMREGNQAAAQGAFAHWKVLEQERRERAVVAIEDGSDVAQSDIH